MNHPARVSSLLSFAALSTAPLQAHHGQDFLVTLGAGLPEENSFNLASGFQFADQTGGDEWATSQALTYA